jgi:hypothetical protein
MVLPGWLARVMLCLFVCLGLPAPCLFAARFVRGPSVALPFTETNAQVCLCIVCVFVLVCLRAGSDKNHTDGIVDGHAYSLIAVKKKARTYVAEYLYSTSTVPLQYPIEYLLSTS